MSLFRDQLFLVNRIEKYVQTTQRAHLLGKTVVKFSKVVRIGLESRNAVLWQNRHLKCGLGLNGLAGLSHLFTQ